ncbi:MAG TPA: TonB-dependent receptor [Gemmatimonadales bacterium]|nr:TonB-dependent receptor [Gemmatimonadales bacterium]
MPARAQILDSIPAAGDTLPPQDTVDETGQFLKAQEQSLVRVPVLPYIGVDGPRAPLSRIVFNRDSIDWAINETLGDLLMRVPGVYLWRGGWIGRPEYPDYQGRGATSVEYYQDGLPLIPLGRDSVAFDPSLTALSLYERIEIERWPGLLRVYLFTWRNPRRSARSRVGLSSGDKNISRYLGSLERRFNGGIGLALAGEYLDAPSGSGFSSGHTNTHYWLQLSYVPSENFGVTAQTVRMSPKRDAFLRALNDTIGDFLVGDRKDDELRVFYKRGKGDLGLRADLLYGHSAWRGSGVNQVVDQVGAVVSLRGPSIQLGGSAFHRSRWTTWDFRGTAGWTGIRGVTVNGEAVLQQHEGNRTSRWVSAGAGLSLPFGVVLSGSARLGSVVAAPAIDSEEAQDIVDLSGRLSWQRTAIGLEVGLTQTDAFRPESPQPFLLIDSLRAPGTTRWLTFAGRISPRQWMTLEGWYSDPLQGTVDGIPPTHSSLTGTIRSRFLRTFPSGIFELKLQLGMEAWSDGVIGRDAGGAAITLGGATFFRSVLQMKLGSLIMFWDRLNLSGNKRSYVPEYFVPRFGSTFGVRWEFSN